MKVCGKRWEQGATERVRELEERTVWQEPVVFIKEFGDFQVRSHVF